MNQDENNIDEGHLQQQQQQQRLAEYYKLFDERTNDGRVFDEDMSAQNVNKTRLTSNEAKARTNYEAVIKTLRTEYKKSKYVHPIATTKEEVLQQRVVAPCLAPKNVSSRAATNERRAGREYPKRIHAWTDFRENVENYKINEGTSLLDEALNQIFLMSLNIAETSLSDEAAEQQNLIYNLNMTLRRAGIVHSIAKNDRSLQGNPDFCIRNATENVSIICECKSTHNLLLPMTADKCKEEYDSAYSHTNVFPKAWSNVAHPIGQLLFYLVDNRHCYGALTSGTRTYFIKLEVSEHGNNCNYSVDEVQASDAPSAAAHSPATKKMKTGEAAEIRESSDTNDVNTYGDGEIKVYISDAWFVGQANYLRAWAYVHSLRETMQPLKKLPNWIRSSSIVATPEQREGKPDRANINNNQDSTSPNDGHSERNECVNKFANTCNREYYYPIHDGAIAFVPYDNIVTVGVLGEGRNGGCFKVKWNGTEYAMKQFDIGRNGDKYFVKEIRAYMLLKDVWGILVPRPIFLSESYSGNVMFLGLQLGHESENEEDYKKFKDVLQRLKKEYGIRHNDAECGRNMIVITDANGKERVVAIDFEDWDEVQDHQ